MNMNNHMQINRVRNISTDDFDELVQLYQPFILENAIEDWGALTKWTPAYLRHALGGLQVKCKHSDTHIHPNIGSYYETQKPISRWRYFLKRIRPKSSKEAMSLKSMSFGEYLDLISDPVEGARYYLTGDELLIFNGKWSPELEVLRDDFILPKYFDEQSMNSAGLWFSAKGVRSHLHFDGGGSHNLNAQITGRKYVQMYSPYQMSSLYPYYFTHFSNIGRYNFSKIDVENFSKKKFPLFDGVECHEGEIKKGDLLFVPAYWYHSFKHLDEFNSNINFWWVPESIQLSPVSARDALMRASQKILSKDKVAPFGLLKLINRLEENIIKETFEENGGKLSRSGVQI
ncbi:cupin-like domain-containing protein (plasmid) [Mycetohabitans rhizoxinica]